MKSLNTVAIFLLALLGGQFAIAQSGESIFLVKFDAIGLVASLPGNEYLKLSPELEFAPKSWGSVSITMDFEYYHGILHVQNLKLLQQHQLTEFYYGKDYRSELSSRLGLRKYFGDNESKAMGLFGEAQLGVSWNKRDSVYDLANQFGEYISTYICPELRLRAGYQNKFSNRLWYTFSVEGDARRIITQEKWYRIVLPEFNIAYRF